MRVDVKKMLFVGLSDQKESFFRRAQEVGVIDFIDDRAKVRREVPEDIYELLSALRVIRGLPVVEQEVRNDFEKADEIVSEINTLHKELALLDTNIREVRISIADVSPVGDWNQKDLDFIETHSNRVVQFFCAKEGHFEEKDLPSGMVHINSRHGLDYFFSFSKEEIHPEGMIEQRFEETLSELMIKYAKMQQEIVEKEKRLKQFAKYDQFLRQALIVKHNSYELQKAKELPKTELDENLFAVVGWVPSDRLEKIKEVIQEFGVHYEEVEIEPTDKIPTCLKNEGIKKSGEDLVHIYDTPAHTDKDPSIWVLCSFALFFSMIVGDGGYGLVFMGITLYLRYRFPKVKGAGKRVLKLATLLCTCCIVWGLLTHSFFGLDIGLDHPIRKVSVLNWLVEKKAAHHVHYQDDVYTDWVNQFPELKEASSAKEVLQKGVIEKDGKVSSELAQTVGRSIMLELALLIGVIHIILSLARYIPRSLSHIGWIMTLVGGYLYFPHYLGATSLLHYAFGLDPSVGATEGIYLMGGGLGLAIALAIITEGLMGLVQLTNIIQIFADVMSYLRLYALGMASAIVSETVNDLSAAVPFVVGIVLIICGHAINMALGIMGGVIHGLRLNFLEWYHYSFEGGGKLYNPLRMIE